MKVLIAPDKFRGTLSAQLAAEAMAEGVRKVMPDWQVEIKPVADGGEGTAAILTAAANGTIVRSTACDPLFRQVACEYGLSEDGSTAYIDSSEPVGLNRLQPSEYNPMRTSSRGVGELMQQALQKRVKRIVVGLGGTATMDAGTGVLQALGVNLLNEDERTLMPTGANLGKIEYIELSKFSLNDRKVEIIFLYDVAAPLITDNADEGVMRFGDQKGLKPEDKDVIFGAFGNFRNLMESQFKGQPKLSGMGAAGGMAFGLSAIYPCQLEQGAKWVLQALAMDHAIHQADLVITGEGCLDDTTALGKCPSQLADMAVRQGKPIIAVVGKNLLEQEAAEAMGFSMVVPTSPTSEDVLDLDSTTAFMRVVEATAEAIRALIPKLKA